MHDMAVYVVEQIISFLIMYYKSWRIMENVGQNLTNFSWAMLVYLSAGGLKILHFH